MTESRICSRTAETRLGRIGVRRTVGQKLDVVRLRAWTRALDALAEQRDALECRIWRADPDDIHLGADCRAWCELARALGDYLRVAASDNGGAS